jgi:peptide deformylase
MRPCVVRGPTDIVMEFTVRETPQRIALRYDINIYGNPSLKEKSEPIGRVNDDIRRLAKDMLTAMYRANGLGLAAQQVGRREAICVIDVPAVRKDADGFEVVENPEISMPLVLINPRITASEGTESCQEGCLSFPEVYVTIKRARQVAVEFMNLAGQTTVLTVKGLLARAVQHEMDHLDGVLLVDRMSATQKFAIAGRLRKLQRQGRAEAAG